MNVQMTVSQIRELIKVVAIIDLIQANLATASNKYLPLRITLATKVIYGNSTGCRMFNYSRMAPVTGIVFPYLLM